jgi:hypothetical protein
LVSAVATSFADGCVVLIAVNMGTGGSNAWAKRKPLVLLMVGLGFANAWRSSSRISYEWSRKSTKAGQAEGEKPVQRFPCRDARRANPSARAGP